MSREWRVAVAVVLCLLLLACIGLVIGIGRMSAENERLRMAARTTATEIVLFEDRRAIDSLRRIEDSLLVLLKREHVILDSLHGETEHYKRRATELAKRYRDFGIILPERPEF